MIPTRGWGKFHGPLLELEATNCSKVTNLRWKIRYLSANIEMRGGKGWRGAYAPKQARLGVAGVLREREKGEYLP